MDRAKIVFLAIAVVAVGAAAGLGLLAKGKFSSAAAAEASCRSDYDQLSKIYRKEVFPSPGNIEALRRSAAELEASRAAITGALARCNVPLVGDMSPSAFIQKLGATIKTQAEKAPIVDGVKAVAPNFAFGFDAYVGSNPAMPLESEVPRLGQQLVIVSWVVREMYAAQVSQITKIQREAQDHATLDRSSRDEAAAGRRRYRGAEEPEGAPESVAARSRGKGKGKAAEPAEPLFTSQRLVLEFAARQDALIDLLNRIASMRAFVVATDMAIKKAAPDLRLPSSVAAAAEPAADEEAAGGRRASRRRAAAARGAPAEAPAAGKTSDLPPEMRVMSGPDVDPPLSVRLELEVYSFGKEGE